MAKRAMTSEKASHVKRQGHKDALNFAILLGLKKDYQNDIKAKKDVIDQSGYSYSVKSGEKKWQIFLYSQSRFQNDVLFQSLNGLGDLFVECINAFPPKRKDYLKNKLLYKKKLSKAILKIKNYFTHTKKLKAFFAMSFFNGNEVDFLVIKENARYNIFHAKDVVDVLAKNCVTDTSKKRKKGELDHQKVVFKIKNEKNKLVTIGEIEMRNDSDMHYREVKFWMSKPLTLNLLKTNIKQFKDYSKKIRIFGSAIKKFQQRKNVTR